MNWPSQPERSVPRLLISAPASGSGKTTVSVGLAAALRGRGKVVAPFKVGPDYIDPSFHALAAGQPCRNLDSWLVPHQSLLALFTRAVANTDLALIEGVMGLFDGRSGAGEAGSTAEVAKLLAAPVVLVLDIGRQARSAAATALGFQRFDQELPVAGFVLNRAGSARHGDLVRHEVESATGLPVFGVLPREAAVQLPERHLGLVPSQDLAFAQELVGQLGALVSTNLDLGRLEACAQAAPPISSGSGDLWPQSPPGRPRPGLAVAQDEAFSFYYRDNLDLLAAWGAELLPFSPLREPDLPLGSRGLYLGGGFPELHAQALASNQPLLKAVRRAAAEGMPIYAECGGLMYLAESLTDFEGRRHSMAGLIPCETAMADRRKALGYVELETGEETLLCPAGRRLRGHEFHWSYLTRGSDAANAYRVLGPNPRLEGFNRGQVLASYIHLHFGSERDLARRFVAALH